MEERILIITPEDKVISKTYHGNMSIQEAVGGYEENCGTQPIPVIAAVVEGKENLDINIYSNGSFAISNDEQFEKINAVASLIAETEIRGNAVVLLNEGIGKERGFKYEEEEMNGTLAESPCECWTAETTIKGFIHRFRDIIHECHEQFDNNKEESLTPFISLKLIEMAMR